MRADHWTGRLLTLRPVLWLGMISYSAYLWHQPLLAFARLAQTEPRPWLLAAMAVLSLLLGHVSWRYVEAPFRRRSFGTRRIVFFFAGTVSVLFVLIGVVLAVSQGAPQRWPASTLALLDPPKTRIEVCPAVDAWLHVCRLGLASAPGEVALVGDSHAYALGSALDERLLRDQRGGFLVHTGCHPIDGLFDSREADTPSRRAHCAEAHRRLLAFVARPEVLHILVAIRWTARLYPMDQRIDAPAFDNGEGGVERDYPYRRNLAVDAQGRLSDAAEPKARAMTAYLGRLAALKPTVLLDPVPEVGWLPTRLNLLAIAQGRPTPDQISTSAIHYAARNAVALELLDGVQAPQLQHSRPQNILCNTRLAGRCVVQADGKLFYYDDDHLSMLGARLVVDDLLAKTSTTP